MTIHRETGTWGIYAIRGIAFGLPEAKIAIKNPATFLESHRGQTMKIGLQGTCKVAFFPGHTEQMLTKFCRYFKGLHLRILEAAE
jgi:hypothetical protein